MNKLFKKFLSLSSVAMGGSLITSSVVSCGLSLSSLMNREIDNETYKGIYQFNVTSWNTAHTMQAEDGRFLSDTNDTLISSDPYGRMYGALVESEYGQENGSNGTVGKSEEDSKKWTYKFRDNIFWTNSKGEKVDKVKPSDVIKAAKYALVENNGSDVSTLWLSFIKGADTIYDEIKNLDKQQSRGSSSQLIDKVFENHKDDFGIQANDEKGLLTFILTKPSPYFESLLNYSVFSPIYDPYKGMITDYKEAYFNGAYIPEVVNPNGKIVLVANPNYHLKENVNIKRLEYSYLEAGSSSRTRTLFESGSITRFNLSADDLKGWNDYIGKDYDNPKFDGAYYTKSADSPGTFLLFYNFFNSALNKGNSQALSASKLLQSKDVRAFLSTSIERSKFVRAFSKTIDDSQISKMLRNTYTGFDVAKNPSESNKDYTEYISDIYDQKSTIQNNLASKSWTLKDGNDAYLNKSEALVGKSQSQLIESINEFIEKEKIERKNGKVVLRFILNPSTSTSLNPYVNFMVKTFNAIPNNPIKIETFVPTSTDEYRTEASKGNFDMFVSGWSPDFKDPSTFLETLTLGGSYTAYNGNKRLFKSKASATDDEMFEGKYYVDKKLITSETKDLFNSWYKYTNDYEKTDLEETDITKRYQKFAQEEYSMLYENFNVLPLYTRAMPKTYVVDYTEPYSKSYEAFGTSQFKHYGAKMNKKLLSREESTKIIEEYSRKLAIIDKDWEKCRTGPHWKTQTSC